MYSASDQECLVARVVEPRRQECAATIHQHRLQQRQQLQQQQRPAPLASACRASRDARYGRASAYAWTAALALVPRTCCCSGGGGCVREQTNEQQQRRRWIVCVFVVYQVPRCATRGARSWVGGQVVLTPWHPPRHRWRSRTWPRLRVPRANRRSCRCAARLCLCGVASELHSFNSQRISTLRGRGAARSICVLVEACASTCPPMGFFGSGGDFESAPVSARLALARQRVRAVPAMKLKPAPGSDTTWLVMKTAMLNSSAIFCSIDSMRPSFCCRSANSPRPE